MNSQIKRYRGEVQKGPTFKCVRDRVREHECVQRVQKLLRSPGFKEFYLWSPPLARGYWTALKIPTL